MASGLENLHIRRAKPEDIGDIRNLIGALGYSATAPKDMQKVLQQYISSNSLGLLIAELGVHVVGLLSYTVTPILRLGGNKMEIEELVIREADRNKGIGAVLLKRAREIAKESNVRRIQISTNPVDKLTGAARESVARRFYVKNGFEVADRITLRQEFERKA